MDINTICTERGYTLLRQFNLGQNSDTVALVEDSAGNKLVVKLATKQESVNEILMNLAGYKELTRMGLGYFIPRLYEYTRTEGYIVIVMEYLGSNFLEAVKDAGNTTEVYERFVRDLQRAYITSLAADAGIARNALSSFVELTISTYQEFVAPFCDAEQTLEETLQKLRGLPGTVDPQYCCFSDWDFTPEDVYINEPIGVMYSDPHTELLGLPLIDMACFSGLVKLYGLPGADEGEKIIKDFALTTVADLLQIDRDHAYKVFLLGRLFQSFMSIRFRQMKTPEQARAIFEQAKIIAAECAISL